MIHWYDGIAPCRAPVTCDGARHELCWRRGRVSAPAHDVDAELALAALRGGRPCPCVEAVLLCRRGLDVQDLFLLWTEQAEPSIGTSRDLERWARRVGRGSPTGHVAEERRSAVLASLPLGFRRRLALGLFRSIGREPDADRSTSHPGFGPIFSSLVLDAARRAGVGGAGPGSRGANDVRWRLVGPCRAASASTAGRRSILLALRPGWVAEVWAWGLAVVGDRFVLDVIERRTLDEVRVRAVSVGTDGRVVPEVATVRREDADWAF
jgi:hypothetical protein